MRNKLGEIKFYDGSIKDILYYTPLLNKDEFLITTKDGEKYLVSANYRYNEDGLDSKFRTTIPLKIQVYIIKNNQYYSCNNIESVGLRGAWDLFED